jgi:ATP-dependent DNA helicase RecG
MALPVNIDNLLHGKMVEWDRIECKEGWNPEPILKSICAFANDINNWGGGYIIVGVAEENGSPILPPKGLEPAQVDKIQKELLGLTHKIDPYYAPVCEPVVYQDKLILIIWVPGGQSRPYKTVDALPNGNKFYFIRNGSSSVKTNQITQKQLFEMAATVPFDDRICHHASIEDLDLGLIRSFLQDIKSELFEEAVTMPFLDLCKRMRLVAGPDEYVRPLNFALLFFNQMPEKFFRGATTEMVLYNDHTGTSFTEKKFTGPLHHQIKEILLFFRSSILAEKVVKPRDTAKADRFFNYPYEAFEEILVNAFFHRSYEHQSPIEINVRPNKIEILSFPGALPPVSNDSLKQAIVVARDYRNRRIGDIFKELRLTEGRATGLPKARTELSKNGSPEPEFVMDKDRVSFLATLHSNPHFGIEKVAYPTSNDGNKEWLDILLFCILPKSRAEIFAKINVTNQTSNFRRIIQPMLDAGYLTLSIPDKPTSKFQKYQTTEAGKELLG